MAKSDEEYHFIESETPLSYTEGPNHPQKDKDFQTRVKRRNILFILGMVMVFWALYKFMGLLFSQVKQKKASAPVKEQVISQKMPVTQALPLTTTPPISTEELQQMANQKTRLNNLESQVVNMQSTLSDMNAKLSDLSAQVSRLGAQANKPVSFATRKKWHHLRHRVFRGVGGDEGDIVYSYQLQAMLPGRAWLIRSDGSTTTVSLGDKIPGYGTVILINPDAGMVQTSSGAIIKYISQ
jgi:intracellular multiplication protein IcmG